MMAAAPLEERRRRCWDLVAYCARYGHVDVSEWPRSSALAFERALSDIVHRENEGSKG